MSPEVAPPIRRRSRDGELLFPQKAQALQTNLVALSSGQLLNHFDNAKIIAEVFDHDFTKERLFAKYPALLLARSRIELGFKGLGDRCASRYG